MRRGRGVLAGALIVGALGLAAPAAASAAGPATSQGYPCATAPGGTGGSSGGTSGSCGNSSGSNHTQHHAAVLGAAKPPSPPINRTGVAGVLPFTGLQLGVVVGVAALLIAAGMVLRITGRRGQDDS